ncbi:hypothetical protein B0O80DRAFT_507681 [Mortierella sp. GBAus27b]|nr:hypothetical protein B0O80DRAFT_507681 [Mortierella sp. GBAus27b]
MGDVQEASRTWRGGPIRLIGKRKDTSYKTIRSTIKLQNAEKRKSDIRNFVSSIRLGLDYDIYKSKALALLNSKMRIIFFIMMDLAVDVLFCILYLGETQYVISQNKNSGDYPDPYWLFVPRSRALWLIAVTMSCWNAMSSLIRFVFADSKWGFIFSISTLLDAITALPFLISAAFLPTGQFLYVPYFLRSWSAISRLQRALSIEVDIGISDQPFDPVKAKLIGLVACFVAILYNGMAAFLYCEINFAPKGGTPHTIWDAFYFMLITASTVGYGDITPKSYEGKVVIMIFIIVALSVVPGLIAGTMDTIKLSRAGGGSYTQSRGVDGVAKQYLVMIGDFQSSKRVRDMINEFFNKEFSENDVRLVFLSRNKPSEEVKNLLSMPTHKNKTTMLVGNGLDEVDLKRCQVRDAAGVFVIPDRVHTDLESQDTLTTLLAWSLHLYAPDTRVFTFNLLPETASFQWGIVEESICISDVKQLLLAYDCRHQGTATLILNLLHPSEPADSYEDGWEAQYGDGTGNELYFTSVPDVFIGWTFAQVSWFVFQEFQCILIGVDIFLRPESSTSSSSSFMGSGQAGPHSHDPSHVRKSKAFGRGQTDQDSDGASGPKGQYHLTLNPGNSYQLGKFDQLVFVAQSPSDVKPIKRFTMEQYERLVRDEQGHLDESKVDFGKAMNMYYELRESRAGARAAAKRRAENRKDRKAARRVNASQDQPRSVEHGYEVLSSEKDLSTHEGIVTTHSPSASIPGSDSTAKNSKTTRPAWNRALYDDDDDDGDDSDSDDNDENGHSESSGSGGKQETRRTPSGLSHLTDNSNISNKNIPAMDRQQSSEDQHQFLVGALDREDSLRSTQETTSPSNPGIGKDQTATPVSSLKPQTSALDSNGVFPSNFELNAAAAAANDPSTIGYGVNFEGLAIGSSSQSKTATTSADDQGGKEGRNATITFKTQSLRSRREGRSVHETFLPLDETTYIGQTSITRSETQDLPLCHLLHVPPDSFEPLIRDDLSSLKDHVVICADAGQNLYRFISTLRLAQIAREDLKTIVVLCPSPPVALASKSGYQKDRDGHQSNERLGVDEIHGQYSGGSAEVWEAILSFPRVFWVIGNCRHQRDLVRAGILGASSIVVMSHVINGLEGDEFSDSTAIMAHYMIYQTLQQRNLLGRQHIIVEMLERGNIRFMNVRDLSISQAYQGSRSSSPRSSSGGFWMSPIFASGQVLIAGLLDNVLYQAYSKTHIIDLVRLCCGVRLKQSIEMDQMLGIDCSTVCLIETPAQFVVRTVSLTGIPNVASSSHALLILMNDHL